MLKKGISDVRNTAPLHLAASLGDLSAMEVLLDAGAPINATDGNGLSALEVSNSGVFHMGCHIVWLGTWP